MRRFNLLMQVSSRALLRTKQFFLSLLSRKKGSSLNQTFMRRRDGRVMLLFLCLGLFSFMAFLFCIPMSQNKINFFKTFKTSSPTSRILFVFGTSHELVKLAPIIHELRSAGFGVVTCFAGRNPQLVEPVSKFFGISLDIVTNAPEDGQSLNAKTRQALDRIDIVLARVRPRFVVVQGDSTTTMATTMAAYLRKIPVAHVEAGLRTYALFEPFPGEIDRRIVSAMATLHFSPTQHAAANLMHEGIPADRVTIAGDTGIDALLWAVAQPPNTDTMALLESFDVTKRLVVLTIQKRESFDEPINEACAALGELLQRFPDVQAAVSLPASADDDERSHARARCTYMADPSRVVFVDAPSFEQHAALLQRAVLVLADSNAARNQAVALGIPALVLRRAGTARTTISDGSPDSVADHTHYVVTARVTIAAEAARLLAFDSAREEAIREDSPLGAGHAGARIAAVISPRSAYPNENAQSEDDHDPQ